MRSEEDPPGDMKMAYYMMTQNDIQTYNAIQSDAIVAYRAIAKDVREKMNFESGKFSCYNDRTADPEGYRAYCQLERAVYQAIDEATRDVVASYDARMDKLFTSLIQIPAKTKKEVCTLGAIRAREMGISNVWIRNISKPRDDFLHHCVQSWYIYTEDGVWYQKMNENNKARHEIIF